MKPIPKPIHSFTALQKLFNYILPALELNPIHLTPQKTYINRFSRLIFREHGIFKKKPTRHLIKSLPPLFSTMQQKKKKKKET